MLQEGDEVLLSLPIGPSKNQMTCGWVDGSPDDSLRILPGDSYLCLLTFKRPRCAKRREEAQDGAVENEQDSARELLFQPLNTANEPPFFCAMCGALVA
jgi:hypothetical protein